MAFDLKLHLPSESFIMDKIPSTGRALVVAELAKKGPVLFVTSKDEEALCAELSLFGPLIFLPAAESDTLGERFKALQELSNGSALVVTSLQSALQKTADPVWLAVEHISLKVGGSASFQHLKEHLLRLGYKNVITVSDRAEIAWRGGIIDCFASNAKVPLRIEFFDNEIVSLRHFDPISQKSLEKIQEAVIMPARDEASCSILDYFPENVTIAFDDMVMIEDLLVLLKSSSFKDFIEPCKRLVLFAKESLTEISEIGKEGGISWCGLEFSLKHISHPFMALEHIAHDPLLPSLAEDCEITCHFASVSKGDRALLQKRIEEEAPSLLQHSTFFEGSLTSGFYSPGNFLAVIPSYLLTSRRLIKRKTERVFAHSTTPELLHLHPGDLVVHFHHGIGIYRGVEKKTGHLGVENEFLLIEYSHGASLFLPLEKAFLLTKYVGADEKSISLHELGANRWQKQRVKSEVSITTYAKDLVALYAERKLPRTNFCAPDGELYKRFDQEFPHELTDDQAIAIKAISENLTSCYSMDRLICGDVGFGKTEVAMRAALKAVTDGNKQVVILAPTTLLSLQHFETFSERMAGFPIRIGHLSRFVSLKEQQATIKGVNEGVIDILIGTHRVLSKDIAFKNLGLLIIDEEQRFGVKAKEHLKTWKKDVDCLTLSATPIPRTLYLSLSGTRDLSLINTPPYDRLPIKSSLCESDNETIKTALLRELGRSGQAFFIHNRIETIWECKKRLVELLPDVKIEVVHGQMDTDTIDTIFHSFKKGIVQILISTTLVENGIDIPNANTILIDHSENFGLSELHQLRGRVGRWNKRAYCYFLIPPNRTLSEIAYKRLQALTESSGWGGGMKIAMRDLEIRGAGNILGTEQSGQVSVIGFHLYCKLLKKEVNSLQGKKTPDASEIRLELKIDARLPEEYVNAIELRMEFYQRAAESSSLEETDSLFAEMIDRFGPLPQPAVWLKVLSRLRILAALKDISLIKQQQTSLYIEGAKGKRTVLLHFPEDPFLYEKVITTTLG